jgi:hypothetical protein
MVASREDEVRVIVPQAIRITHITCERTEHVFRQIFQAISALRTNLVAMALALAFLASSATGFAAPFNLTQTFLSPTPAAGDHFGCSVAMAGDKVLIGGRLMTREAVRPARRIYLMRSQARCFRPS